MAGIKNCIAKFKDFPESLKNKLISLSDRFKSEGKEDLQADTEAVLAVHKELHDELNDLKRQVKEPIKKYTPPDTKKQVEKVKETHAKEDKAAAEKESELETLATSGKDVNPDGMSEKEYLSTVLAESTNPAEIAGAWLNEYESDASVQKNYDEGQGTTQDMIYAFFKNGGKLSKKSFELHGDKNNLDIAGKRTYFTEKGGKDADVAIAINDDSGEVKYVQAQDVIDFINDHPTGIGSYESKFGDNKASLLHGKFIRLTKKRLTPQFARKLFKKYVEIKDKEENTLPPMTAKEASEEMQKEAAREEVFAETGQFQKKSEPTKEQKADVDKVMERMKKALPKFNIVYNPELDAAGKIDGNKIEINPLYAGTDTPIHEAGHALIDFIGYKNRVIQAGIKQLRDTQFYKDVAAARPELTGELLDKEVLAEAIGKEGAGIFDKEVAKGRFKQVLDYIFTKLKQLLGIDKNIAKSLAKQIIGGIGTKGITPVQTEGKSVTLQMPSGEKVNGKEVQVDVVNGFYSNLEKQLLQIKLEKIPAKQWADKLKGEEAKWTGLTDWLSQQQGSVSKADIQNYLKDNRIQVVEVVNSGKSEKYNQLVEEQKNASRELDILESDSDNWSDENYKESRDKKYELNDKIKELSNKIKEEESKTKDTKFENYQLEGEKENYKEVLVTMPNKIPTYGEYQKQLGYPGNSPMLEKQYLEKYGLKQITDRSSKEFKSSHFEEPNILVHLRMNTRTNAEGNKVLFLEEVQSDWGQKGKREGFANSKDEKIELSSIKEEKEYEAKGYYIQTDMNTMKTYAIKEALKGTPQAPFVTDTNSWTKLSLKVALKEAVKQGADKIAWTTGEQQNDRYDLSKSVDNIEVSNQGEGVGYKVVGMKGGNLLMTQFATAQQLPDVIGKELAQKIIDSKIPYQKTKTFSGFDLKVGGKGMKGFYGSPTEGSLGIVGNVAKKLFNQEPKPIRIETATKNEYNLGEANYVGGVGVYKNGDMVAEFDTKKEANDYIAKNSNQQQYSIDITPELIAQVGGGLPMFQKKDGEKKAKKEPLSPEAQKIKDLYDAIKDIEDVSAIPYEDLLSAYNYAITNEEFRKSSGATKAKDEFVERIGANFYQRNYDKATSDPKFDPMKAAKTDIGGKDILFKALSHFTNNHPELKGLKELYDKAVFKRITETTEKQNTNRKLAIEVIKDRNKSLGIVGRVKENVLNLIFGNRNFKYFDYLEGKDGKFITVDEAKKKNLSEAQINYLKFVRNTVAAKAGVIENLKDNWNSEMEVLKADKKFYESATTENAVAAVSHLLGNTWNISNVRINFINPNTGKEQTADYGEIERIFTKYGNESPVKKAKSVASIIKYNVKARKQLKTGTNIDEAANPLNMVKRGDYVLTKEGKLISRFDRKRSETRSYSKDFYSAINEYIADTEHIQHMQPLIPIIHGIDNLNRLGLYERDENGEISKTIHGQKPNLVKWLNEWSNMHIYKNPKETIPELDVALRFFRNVASMTMMLFNTTAQARNAIMGVVNAFIKENGATIKDGMSRLFGSTQRKINSDYAYGLVNPYALELIKKFKAVSTDIDSNPIRSAGGFLTSLGFAGTKWGEFLVQGSQWLGTMSKEDYNSFTWKKNKFGVDELVFKESIPKEKQEEIEARLLDLVNKVSDVQGKYSEKDRRNIQNSEWGKSIMQYRVWLPDWWRVRFSKDAGHWRNMMGGEIWELRKNLAKAAVDKGYAKAIWQDKNMMSALKELMLITGLFALMYQDDDDEEKSFASKQAMKMLSEMVGVVDPENVKQIIERPIPSMGVVTKFLDAADHLIMLEADDFYKKDSKYGKKGTPKIVGDIRGAIPGKQAIDMVEEALEDEGEK